MTKEQMQIRERLQAVAKEYNEAIDKGKVRELRKVAERSHDTVLREIKEIESAPVTDQQLLDEAMSLFIDIRWGQRTTKFV
ncbi:hypothetical protein D1006_39185 [Burkholderia stabilis]|uniref:Uncharacterized protein n=1 Tax=Burkholderia stabilis TaxID=95485 RepID=A0A4Q2A6S4_9BURK|nr:hypothetical protein [Burkholderia stabilis]RXV64401.1 hypothetical protein D1006_39185 [Burkholderia stabilis]